MTDYSKKNLIYIVEVILMALVAIAAIMSNVAAFKVDGVHTFLAIFNLIAEFVGIAIIWKNFIKVPERPKNNE